jgi:hypothetical protein
MAPGPQRQTMDTILEPLRSKVHSGQLKVKENMDNDAYRAATIVSLSLGLLARVGLVYQKTCSHPG